MKRSLLPAVFMIPIWFVFGRLLLGGAFGWMGVFSIFSVAPVLVTFHCVLWSLEQKHDRLPPANVVMLLAYYICHILLQIFVVDVGDDPRSDGSVASIRLSMNEEVSFLIAFIIQLAIIILMILILAGACMERGNDPDPGQGLLMHSKVLPTPLTKENDD